MDQIALEEELKKRLPLGYRWGRKQNNSWDQQSRFIYSTKTVAELQQRVQGLSPELRNYALNRWFNYWSAMGVERIFCTHSNVTAHTNQYDKLIDFRIEGIPFDHKTSVFPRGFGHNIDYAQGHKRELIQWLYRNQSQQGRKHLKNRLFIVLYDANNEHWKLKAELTLLRTVIDDYIRSFDPNTLEVFDFGQGRVLSDILWLRKEKKGPLR